VALAAEAGSGPHTAHGVCLLRVWPLQGWPVEPWNRLDGLTEEIKIVEEAAAK
jgi:hypothetical protein